LEHEERVRRSLKLRHLQTLGAVARYGSMGKAADHLALSQAAVSKVIAEMERVIGATLLERNSRGAEPTAAGRILLERCKVVFDEIDEALREIVALSAPDSGVVRVGTPGPMSAFLSRTITSVVSRYRGIRHEVAISDTHTLLGLLRERRLDVVVTRLDTDGVDKDFSARALFKDQMAVMCSRDHALARRRRLEFADLTSERWTLSPADTILDVVAREAFEAKGLSLPVAAVVTPSIYMRLSLLQTGFFLTFLPESTARLPMHRDWLKVLPVELPRTRGVIAAITLKRRKPSRATNIFCDAAAASI
jgi:DNA-binding transcriptional LysR family regulator